MIFIFLGSLFFIIFIAGLIFYPMILKILRGEIEEHKKKETDKETIYGTSAQIFNEIKGRELSEKENVNIMPAVRMGGLFLYPPLIASLFFLAYFYNSPVILSSISFVLLVSIIGLYDDYREIFLKGKRKTFNFKHRLITLFSISLYMGYSFYLLNYSSIKILPIKYLDNIDLGLFVIPIFALWFIFWATTEVIDGIDGLASSVFSCVFFFLSILSFMQGNMEALILSTIGFSLALFFFIFLNKEPAKAYLTETGILIYITLFALITYLLATDGYGIVSAFFVGIVLIITIMSVILQLAYRKLKGKKLFSIAPIHHNFEYKGVKKSKIVIAYTLITALSSLLFIAVVSI